MVLLGCFLGCLSRSLSIFKISLLSHQSKYDTSDSNIPYSIQICAMIELLQEILAEGGPHYPEIFPRSYPHTIIQRESHCHGRVVVSTEY